MAEPLGAIVREFVVAADHAATDWVLVAGATKVVATWVLDHVDDIFAVFIVRHWGAYICRAE